MGQNRRIVVDTGPLIALAAIGDLDLLHALFRVVVPEAVIRELAAGAEEIKGEKTIRELFGRAV